MKKTTKLIAALSAAALMAGSFAACGGGKEERVQTDGKNFTYWTVMQGESSVSLKDYNEMLMWQEL